MQYPGLPLGTQFVSGAPAAYPGLPLTLEGLPLEYPEASGAPAKGSRGSPLREPAKGSRKLLGDPANRLRDPANPLGDPANCMRGSRR